MDFFSRGFFIADQVFARNEVHEQPTITSTSSSPNDLCNSSVKYRWPAVFDFLG